MGKVVKLESKQQPSAARTHPRVHTRSQRASPEASPLTPELKDFIDRAIVPVLVKQFLAEIKFAELESDAAHSDSSAAKSIPGRVKP